VEIEKKGVPDVPRETAMSQIKIEIISNMYKFLVPPL
jgi:hypothetical protein